MGSEVSRFLKIRYLEVGLIWEVSLTVTSELLSRSRRDTSFPAAAPARPAAPVAAPYPPRPPVWTMLIRLQVQPTLISYFCPTKKSNFCQRHKCVSVTFKSTFSYVFMEFIAASALLSTSSLLACFARLVWSGDKQRNPQ